MIKQSQKQKALSLASLTLMVDGSVTLALSGGLSIRGEKTNDKF
jgi:hypothetical protein